MAFALRLRAEASIGRIRLSFPSVSVELLFIERVRLTDVSALIAKY